MTLLIQGGFTFKSFLQSRKTDDKNSYNSHTNSKPGSLCTIFIGFDRLCRITSPLHHLNLIILKVRLVLIKASTLRCLWEIVRTNTSNSFFIWNTVLVTGVHHIQSIFFWKMLRVHVCLSIFVCRRVAWCVQGKKKKKIHNAAVYMLMKINLSLMPSVRM